MKANIPSVINSIGAAFILSILPVSGHTLTPDQVFNKVKDSIVVVKTLDAQGKVKGQGSGVLLPSGKIATNPMFSLFAFCSHNGALLFPINWPKPP